MRSRLESQSAKVCKSCKSRHELSNESLLAKFGFDTAENEPPKVCQKIVLKQSEVRIEVRKKVGVDGFGPVVLVAQDEAHPRLDARNLQMLEREEADFGGLGLGG